MGAERFAANFYREDAPHYDRSRMEDDRTAQHAAAVCELAVARALNRYPTGFGAWAAADHAKWRDLPDVGTNTEVRRIREADATTFAVGGKDRNRTIVAAYPILPELRIVKVLGWISGEEALRIGRPAGYGDRVRVPISALSLNGICDLSG